MIHGKLIVERIFNDQKTSKVLTKGRNKNLVNQRNEALLYRSYFYKINFKWSYEIVVKKVSAEFYISPVTASEILAGNVDRINEIKNEKPSAKSLKELFPQFDWSFKVNN